MMSKKLLTIVLMLFSTYAMADGPMCKVTDKSGTIDISECPVEKPWHCYKNYSCDNGTEYTLWGECREGVQNCW